MPAMNNNHHFILNIPLGSRCYATKKRKRKGELCHVLFMLDQANSILVQLHLNFFEL